MPRINLPSTPGVRSAQYGGAAPADKTAQYRGKAALAEGLADVGSVMGQFAERSANIKNERDLTNGRLAMQKAQADIQSDLEANPDPAKWDGLATARFEEASGSIFASADGSDLAPQVRRQLEGDFKKWSSDTTLTVRNQGQRKRNDEADALFVQEQAISVKAGDVESALAVVDKRERLGLISPARATGERKEVAYNVDVQNVNGDIGDDPFNALDKLKDETEGGKPRFYKNLSEKDRLAAMRSAKNGMETARAETVQQLQEDILTHAGIGAEQKIDSWLDAGRILPSQAMALKKFAAGQRTPQDMAAQGSQLWQSAIDLDRADPEFLQKSMQIRASLHTLDPAVRDPILDTLNAKGRNSVNDTVRQAFGLLSRDYQAETDRWTKTELDALSPKERKAAGKPEPGDFKDVAKGEAASEKLFRYQFALDQWIRANPQAKPADILEYRAHLTSGDRQADLGQQAIDDLSGAIQ